MKGLHNKRDRTVAQCMFRIGSSSEDRGTKHYSTVSVFLSLRWTHEITWYVTNDTLLVVLKWLKPCNHEIFFSICTHCIYWLSCNNLYSLAWVWLVFCPIRFNTTIFLSLSRFLRFVMFMEVPQCEVASKTQYCDPNGEERQISKERYVRINIDGLQQSFFIHQTHLPITLIHRM